VTILTNVNKLFVTFSDLTEKIAKINFVFNFLVPPLPRSVAPRRRRQLFRQKCQ
jgi:hypothetical protein